MVKKIALPAGPLIFILVTAIYNLGHIFYLWFLLITSGSPFPSSS